MNSFQSGAEKGAIAKLLALLREHLDLAAHDPQCVFAELMCRSIAAEELARRPLEDLLGEVIEGWRFLAQFDPAIPKIRAFNPDFDQHGWQSPHTVVMILSRDMPFVIDSVRMELNRCEITIHSISNGIMRVERDSSGRLVSMEASDGGQTDGVESLITLEINRHTSAAVLGNLERNLQSVFEEVSIVTDDFAAMQARAQALQQTLQAAASMRDSKLDSAAAALGAEFMAWLLDNHFTFLGYRAYKPNPKGDKLQRVRQSGLGLMRNKAGGSKQRAFDVPLITPEAIDIGALICFAKSPRRSRVHRPAYSDYIIVRSFDQTGVLEMEHRFLGLYTSSVYFQSASMIPVIREKTAKVIARAGLHPGSHDQKALLQILEVYPRDDLFQSSDEELYRTALGVLHIHERRQVRSFIRRDPFGRYYSALVYIPRDIFTTELRKRVQQVLCEELNATEVEFSTFFSESILARTQFILHLPADAPDELPDYHQIAHRVEAVTRSWWDQLQGLLTDMLGEELGADRLLEFEGGIPTVYREDFSPRTGVADIQTLCQLSHSEPLALSFYRPLDQGEGQLNLKLYHLGKPLPLSDIIPIMENLGLRVLDEHPYRIERQQQALWIHDFRMEPHDRIMVELERLRDNFEAAFHAIWSGQAESDRYNQLVLAAELDWRAVVLLRAQAAYMKQTGFPFSRPAIAGALKAHLPITRKLVELFCARLDPAGQQAELAEQLRTQLNDQIDQVESLTHDRILRRFMEQIYAIQRTNYFQRTAKGAIKPQLVIKFAARLISEMPVPVPFAEIFVYSPRMEGVHLRNGAVARGGLRWSDRNEDYRTEILGLVKAQQVKNALIVPVGAKGGFVCKRSLESMTPEQKGEEGLVCYKMFISGLLDVSDNLVDGKSAPPAETVRHDGDDPYLVVAADKGTARYSDHANGIAADYGFWLGDAFASGGSQGYDHKQMGITARGAWVAVQRHFRERGINIQKTPFTVVGIGDMGGDVFGNGMLLSPCIQLVAAFNHEHIFIDPNPDTASSFTERQRLFAQGKGWGDYDSALLSKGGCIVRRSAKSIEVNAYMRARFGFSGDRLAPNELISRLLQAPVDLLWNGGIGTYVKARSETHQEVGDKANDGVRIDAYQLRCRVVGEGGNLGLTQRGRIEFALGGGACNSDFIDNAAGVDCSDHEVNIKILLDALIEQGELTVKQRNQLLAEMTDEVANLVLVNSYRQSQAISIAERQCRERMTEYRHLITRLEQHAQLERALEHIPSDEQLEERQSAGGALTRSELAVLVAYTKANLKEVLAVQAVVDDPLMQVALASAFPARLSRDWPQAMQQHRLRPQLIASQVANQLVNHMGLTFLARMHTSANADAVLACRAYMIMRAIYDLDRWWEQIEQLDNHIDAEVQLKMMAELQRLLRRASRWLLRSRGSVLDSAAELARFGQSMQLLAANLGEWLHGALAQKWRDRFYFYNQAGVPDALAKLIASVDGLYVALSIVEIAEQTDAALKEVVQVYCLLGEQLDIFRYLRRIDGLQVGSGWQAKARESFRDDLDAQVRRLAIAVLNTRCNQEVNIRFQHWMTAYSLPITRWLTMLGDLKQENAPDYAIFAVISRELADLAEVTPQVVAD